MPKNKLKATIDLMTKLTGKTTFPLHTVYKNQLVTTRIEGKEKFKEYDYEGEMLFIFLMINIPHQTYDRLKQLMNSEQVVERLDELMKKHKVLR